MSLIFHTVIQAYSTPFGGGNYNDGIAKFFAVTVIVIAILVALPIILHFQPMPPDISTTGNAPDRQMSETMFEAGVLFLAAQFLLGFCVWKFAGHGSSSAILTLPGGASAIVIFAVVVVGVEVWLSEWWVKRRGRRCISHPHR
jgi:hypothetical protein